MRHVARIFAFIFAFTFSYALVLPSMPEIEPISDEVPMPQEIPFPNSCDLEPSVAVAARPSLTIQIRRHDPDFEIMEQSLSIDPAAKATATDIDLDLGETIENQIIALMPVPHTKQEFKIEQQFETSMALGDEGPHYDLTHWKHYTSPWQEIKSIRRNQFLTTSLTEADNLKFPKVTQREIVEFLKRDGASKRWIALGRSCKDANSGACYTTANRISFRISTKENGRWKHIHTLNFSIPMGC